MKLTDDHPRLCLVLATDAVCVHVIDEYGKTHKVQHNLVTKVSAEEQEEVTKILQTKLLQTHESVEEVVERAFPTFARKCLYMWVLNDHAYNTCMRAGRRPTIGSGRTSASSMQAFGILR